MDFRNGEVGPPYCKIAHPSKKSDKSKQRQKRHMEMRLHKSQCSAAEWRDREVVAGLRDLHLEGRYNELR